MRGKGKGLTHIYVGGVCGIGGTGWFKPGHQLSRAESLSDEANMKRRMGMIRTWATMARKRNGEKVVTARAKDKRRRRLRVKLWETTAKDSREIVEKARMNSLRSMEILTEIMNNEDEPTVARIQAANAVLDRAYGKASQTNVNVDANDKPAEVSKRELHSRIEEALRRVEAITGRTTEAPESQGEPVNLRKLN